MPWHVARQQKHIGLVTLLLKFELSSKYLFYISHNNILSEIFAMKNYAKKRHLFFSL